MPLKTYNLRFINSGISRVIETQPSRRLDNGGTIVTLRLKRDEHVTTGKTRVAMKEKTGALRRDNVRYNNEIISYYNIMQFYQEQEISRTGNL